jgi:DNA-binding HxlR family transcriptional regulator
MFGRHHDWRRQLGCCNHGYILGCLGLLDRRTQVSETTQISKEVLGECKIVHASWNELTKVWTLPVIHALGLKEPARFNELKRRIEGISATSLAERLSELERGAIVQRKVYPDSPPRVEYSLTKKGWELHAILGQLAEWAVKWSGAQGQSVGR